MWQTHWLNFSHKQNMITPKYSLGVNHIAMWTRLLTLVNLLSVGHMAMWTMGVNHIKMWTIGVKSHGDVN